MTSLNNKIQELETQNRALASMLVHQLRGESPNNAVNLENSPNQWIDEERQKDNKDASANTPSPPLLQTSLNIKHYNSFNSEVFEESPNSENCDNKIVSNIDKRLSADTANILGNKTHQLYCNFFCLTHRICRYAAFLRR